MPTTRLRPRTLQILCKPKIMPLKSITLEKLEEMQRQMAEFNAEAKGE